MTKVPLLLNDDHAFWDTFDEANGETGSGLDWATFDTDDNGYSFTEQKNDFSLAPDWKVEQNDKLHNIFSRRRSETGLQQILDEVEVDGAKLDRRKGRAKRTTSNSSKGSTDINGTSILGERRRSRILESKDGGRTQSSTAAKVPSMRRAISMDDGAPGPRLQYKSTPLVQDSSNHDERRRSSRRTSSRRLRRTGSIGCTSSDHGTISSSNSRHSRSKSMQRSLHSDSSSRLDISRRSANDIQADHRIQRANSLDGRSIKDHGRRRSKRSNIKSSLKAVEDLEKSEPTQENSCNSSFHTSSSSSGGTSANSRRQKPSPKSGLLRKTQSSQTSRSAPKTQARSPPKRAESSSSTAKSSAVLSESSKCTQSSANLQRMNDLAGRCQYARQQVKKAVGNSTFIRARLQRGDTELSLEEVFATPSSDDVLTISSLRMSSTSSKTKLGIESIANMSGITMDSRGSSKSVPSSSSTSGESSAGADEAGAK